MVRVLIIEDHEEEAMQVKEAIERISSSSTLSYDITIITERFDEEKLSGYDLYFLDINMGPYYNGFDIADTIQKLNKQACLMFCSNHENLVFESFHVNVMFFVRKKHLEQDIANALCKFENHYKQKNRILVKWIQLPTRDYKIQLENILYLESDDNYTYIFFTDGTFHKIKMSLKKIMNQLQYEKLVQISRTVVVNISYVARIRNDCIYLNNQKHVYASKRKMNEIRKLILESDD